MAFRRLAVALIFISFAPALFGSSHEKPPHNLKKQSLIQEEPKSDCPEFCTCVRKIDDGMIAKCDRITATQQFDDRYSDFKLSADSRDSNETLTLDDRFFIHLQLKSVQSISIVDMEINSIDKNAFKELHNLVLVSLTNNSVIQINPDTFSTNKNLRQLSLSGNPLAYEGTLNNSLNVPYLQELDLSSCHLHALTNVFFSKLTLLAYLNLESNNLNVINSDTFRNLTSLEELNLANNNIFSLKEDLFIYNEALAQLTLRNNPLVTIENILLPGVVYLDLSLCKFAQISEYSFNGVEGATNLNLSHNVITEISVNAFVKMPKLAYLDLSNNSLDTPLDENLFVKNNQLETLSLKNNPNMKLLPEDGFKGSFEDFFKLNVANCGIERLSSASLRNLPNLSQLDLSRNLLTSFNGDIILQPEVKHLNLAFNKISNSNDIQFPEKCQIRKLSLAGNKIKHLQTHFFGNLQFLTSLDLSHCALEDLWQNRQDEIRTLPMVNTINLSNNNLHTVTREDLEVFSNLQTLNLIENPLDCDIDLTDLVKYLSDAKVGSFEGQHATEATFGRSTWQDFLLKMHCSPLEPVVKQNRGSNYDAKDLYEDYLNRRFEHSDEQEDEDEEEYKEEEDDEIAGREEEEQASGKYPPDQFGEISDEQPVWGSSMQVVVMLVAAVTTFVVIVAVVVLVILCRSRMLLHREAMAKRRGHRLNVYKPLFDHEHLNSPTTPIMKSREISVGPRAQETNNVSV